MESQGRTQRTKKRKRASSTTSSTAPRQLPTQADACPNIFAGLKICLTGQQTEREDIAKCVERRGGKWCPGLKKDVDILIAEHAQGDKYAWAKTRGAAVVKRGWYVNSVAQGRVMGVELSRLEGSSREAAGGKEDGKASTHASVSQTEDAAQHATKRQRMDITNQSTQSKEAAKHVPVSVVASQAQVPKLSDVSGEQATAVSPQHSLDTAHDTQSHAESAHESTQCQAPPRSDSRTLARVGSGYTPPPSSGTVAKSKSVRPIVTATGSFAALQPDAEDDTDVDDALLDSFDHGGDPFKALDDVKPEATPAAVPEHHVASEQEQQASSSQVGLATRQLEVTQAAPPLQSQATQASTSPYGMDSTLTWNDALSQVERTEKAMADTERGTKAMAARGVAVVPDPPQEMFWFLSKATIPPGAKKVYAVRRGRKPYFYFDWGGTDGAQAQTVGFPNALFKGFKTSSPRCCEDAMFFMNHNPGDCGQPGSGLGKCNPPCRPAEIEYKPTVRPGPTLPSTARGISALQPSNNPGIPVTHTDIPERRGACEERLEDPRAVLCASCAFEIKVDPIFQKAVQDFDLHPEQIAVLQFASQGRNVFYTDAAGTGKSTLLRAMVQFFHGHKRGLEVISPTAMTALNVGGRTIHSLAGWGTSVDQKPLDDIRKDAGRQRIWERLHVIEILIIDEVSMVSSNTMVRLNAVLQQVMKSDQPFGGVQVIICGDFFQLPPVKPFHHCIECGAPTEQDTEQKKLRRCVSDRDVFDDNDKWAFACPDWDDLQLQCIELTTIHRQADPVFTRLLNKYRVGTSLTREEGKLLFGSGSMVDEAATKIYPHVAAVSSINAAKLAELDTKEYVFQLVDNCWWNGDELDMKRYDLANRFEKTDQGTFRYWEEERHRYEEELHLKEGMPVILLTNVHRQENLVNGSQGVIVGFESYSADKLPRAKRSNREANSLRQWIFMGDHAKYQEREVASFCNRYKDSSRILWPIVQFKNGKCCTIYPFCDVTEIGSEEPYSIMSRTQVPLLAAWAITTHKSQGMTLDLAVVDMNGAWEYGQCYTAMSRVRSLEGLKVYGRPAGRAAGADQVVKDFMKNTQWVKWCHCG